MPVDGRGVRVELAAPPQRIVSLVPSTTETVCALGAGDRLVGVTRFCVHPRHKVRDLPKVGGTKDVDADRVRALKPDLILGNCEENSREIFDALSGIAPLFAPFPRTVSDAISDLLHTGELVGCAPQAQAFASTARANLTSLTDTSPWTFAYLIWRGPFMAVGADTFISDMLCRAGGENVFSSFKERFPVVQPEQVSRANPDVVLLSSEPFPFKQSHRHELCALTGLSADRVRFVDGEMCSWHGVRMIEGLAYLARCRANGFPIS